MRARLGCSAIIAISLALLAAVGYTGYAGTTIYRQLDSGRQELVAAQASISAATQSGDPAQLQAAVAQLKQAERDFSDAAARSRDDPALRLAGSLPSAGRQLNAVTHLAAIGADMSRAGQAAATVGIAAAGLKQQYAGRTLTPDDLQTLLQQAQGLAKDYSASTETIGAELRAAHGERARVTTTDLIAPLKAAYDEVDRALGDADTALLHYQDVKQLLSDFLGVRLPP
jgi:hypothetical protein